MKDYIIRGIDKNKNFKFAIARTTNIVDEAQNRHNTSPTATAALGRTLTAIALMSTDVLKNKTDSMTLTISGDGPLGDIVTFANKEGHIKGFVQNPQADLPIKGSKLDVGGLVGSNGYVQTMIDLGLKDTYTGRADLISGEIGEDIANYYLSSEQTNTAISLGVLINPDGNVSDAGGYIVQLLPGAQDEEIEKLENNIKEAKPISQMIGQNEDLEELIKEVLRSFYLDFLQEDQIEFKCDCSKEKTEQVLISLGRDELKNIIKEDDKAEIVCHYCSNKYTFTREELEDLIERI